jgi:hypothetical protein
LKTDDYRHIPEEELDWRESYYFNFVSRDNKTSGFTTIGILPNQEKAEFVLALIHEDKQKLYYKEQKATINDQSSSLISDKILTYKLIEPLHKWEIEFVDADLELNIQWTARFPPFDFGKGSGTSWKGHFEQSGIIKGAAKLSDGRKIKIDGYGQRDKSWGPRDWHIENWFALHAQFETYAVGLRRDTVNGLAHISGGITSAKKQSTASQVDLEITYGKGDCPSPTGALTNIRFVDGNILKLKSRLISPESFVRFSRSFPKGSTELFEGLAIHEAAANGERGTGLIEFLTSRTKP